MDGQGIRKEVSKKNKEIEMLLTKIKDHRSKKKTMSQKSEERVEVEGENSEPFILSAQELSSGDISPIKKSPEEDIERELTIIKSHLDIILKTPDIKQNLVAIKKQITKLKAKGSESPETKKRVLDLQKHLDLERHKRTQAEQESVNLRKQISELSVALDIKEKQGGEQLVKEVEQLRSVNVELEHRIQTLNEQLIGNEKSRESYIDLNREKERRLEQHTKTIITLTSSIELLKEERKGKEKQLNGALDEIRQKTEQMQSKEVMIQDLNNLILTLKSQSQVLETLKGQVMKRLGEYTLSLKEQIEERLISQLAIIQQRTLDLSHKLSQLAKKATRAKEIREQRKKYQVRSEELLEDIDKLKNKASSTDAWIISLQREIQTEKLKYETQVELNQQYKRLADSANLQLQQSLQSSTRVKELQAEQLVLKEQIQSKDEQISSLREQCVINNQLLKSQISMIDNNHKQEMSKLTKELRETIQDRESEIEDLKEVIEEKRELIEGYQREEKTMKRIIENYAVQNKSGHTNFEEIKTLRSDKERLQSKMGETQKANEQLQIETQRQQAQHTLLIKSLQLRYQELEKEEISSKQRLGVLEKQAESWKEKETQFGKTKEELYGKLSEHNTKVLALQKQVKQAEKENAKLEKVIAQLKEQSKDTLTEPSEIALELKSQIQNLQVLNTSLGQQIEELKQQYQILKGENQQMSLNLKEAVEKTNLLETTIKSHQKEKKELDTKLKRDIAHYQDKLRQEVERSSKVIEQMAHKHESEGKKMHESHQTQKKKLLAQLKSLKPESSSVSPKKPKEDDTTETQLKAKQGQIEELESTVRILEDSLQSLSKKYMAIIQELNQQISDLNQENYKLSTELQNTSTISQG